MRFPHPPRHAVLQQDPVQDAASANIAPGGKKSATPACTHADAHTLRIGGGAYKEKDDLYMLRADGSNPQAFNDSTRTPSSPSTTTACSGNATSACPRSSSRRNPPAPSQQAVLPHDGTARGHPAPRRPRRPRHGPLQSLPPSLLPPGKPAGRLSTTFPPHEPPSLFPWGLAALLLPSLPRCTPNTRVGSRRWTARWTSP